MLGAMSDSAGAHPPKDATGTPSSESPTPYAPDAHPFQSAMLQDEHDESPETLSRRFPGLNLVQQQHHDEFLDPLSKEIQGWLHAFAKAVKGMRVYAMNNQMLRRYLDEAYKMLAAVLTKTPEVTLFVREDRLLYGKDPVHINTDREEGLPFTFYRNAFRRITFVAGITREEMVNLIRAVITDYAHYDYAGEDLLTELWRLALPHLRYLTIDAMALESKAVEGTDREELDRIQSAIEDIVARIYKTSAQDDDIVAGVSITKEDLEALKDIRSEEKEDLDLLDVITARAIADVPPKELGAIREALAADSRDTLSTTLIDILTIILFKEQSASESSATIALIQELFDSLLVAQRYDHAIYLVSRLREHQAQSPDLKVVHITRHLLKLFSAESRVVPVLQAFNDDRKTAPVQVMLQFLRSLGPGIVPTLIGALDFLNSQSHRRLICDLVLEYGTPDRHLLWEKMQTAKWFVVRDILQMAQRLPLEHMVGIVDTALKHEHPKVREHAVGLLRGYARGTADRLVAKYLLDEDLEVRIAAIRVAAARRSADAKALIEVLLAREDLADREPRELRLLMAAYAAIGGWKVIPTLDKILSPGFFARSKMTEAQVAAAFALASVGNVSAKAALQRGMRTLNARVREACKKALARDFVVQEAGELAQGLPGAARTPSAGVSQSEEPAFMLGLEMSDSEHDAISSISSNMIDPLTLSEEVQREPIAIQQRFVRSLGVDEHAPEFEVAVGPPAEKPSRAAGRSIADVGRVAGTGPIRDEIPRNLPSITPDLPPSIPPNPRFERVAMPAMYATPAYAPPVQNAPVNSGPLATPVRSPTPHTASPHPAPVLSTPAHPAHGKVHSVPVIVGAPSISTAPVTSGVRGAAPRGPLSDRPLSTPPHAPAPAELPSFSVPSPRAPIAATMSPPPRFPPPLSAPPRAGARAVSPLPRPAQAVPPSPPPIAPPTSATRPSTVDDWASALSPAPPFETAGWVDDLTLDPPAARPSPAHSGPKGSTKGS